jgi:D-cysteine desulfhydrase
MEREEPLLFNFYSKLRNRVPWISLLTIVPTPVERLDELEQHYNISSSGGIYIKRDDKDHKIYGGNKLRKFEFIFGDILAKKKKGVMSFGGMGTNHGLACAIVAQELGLKCDLFLAYQPLTWHVQRSLLLYDYFGANLHYSKSHTGILLKGLGFRLIHPSYYVMLPGGSTLLGLGSPNGTLGFINAIFELKKQIDKDLLPEPDAIFVACGSAGTAAGLIAGCKLLDLKTKIHAVQVSSEPFASKSSVISNSNKALKYLRKKDKSVPKIKIIEEDFEFVEGYLGSDYGVKTKRGQNAIDLVMELEGYRKGFKLETTYTGKAMAALLDYIEKKENKEKDVLFWNTYNSADLDDYVRETNFDYKKLPKEFHKFYEEKQFQCWQYKECPQDKDCDAYLNHEYRCWKVKNCTEDIREKCEAYKNLTNIIQLEDA